ncbi:MAG TPA: hypothetical protein VGB94_12855 [Acidobacteriaceae bacterium]
MPRKQYPSTNPFRLPLFLLLALLFSASSTHAQSSPPHLPEKSSPLSRTPLQWVSAAAALELPMVRLENPYLRYHMLYQGNKGIELRDEIESRDGMVARLIALNGQPLTPEKDAAERARLQYLLDNPQDFYDHHKTDQDGKNLAVELIQQLPHAMFFTYAADQTPAGHFPGSQVVIDFTPDPAFKPKTTKGEALRGLAGRIWIETNTGHMVRMHATIIKDTNIGWGILARIYKGGVLDLEQTDTGHNHRWVFSRLDEHITVRALLVKTINVNVKLQSSGYQPIQSLRFQDAIHILLDTPLPTHCPCN